MSEVKRQWHSNRMNFRLGGILLGYAYATPYSLPPYLYEVFTPYTSAPYRWGDAQQSQRVQSLDDAESWLLSLTICVGVYHPAEI